MTHEFEQPGHSHGDLRDALLHDIEHTATPAHHAAEDIEHYQHESHTLA